MAQVQVHAPRELATSPPLTSAALQAKNSPLLPFNVTPPKKTGPSEAERKIEALTRQIEEQMEKDAESEYFGEFPDPFSSEKLWRQILVGVWNMPPNKNQQCYQCSTHVSPTIPGLGLSNI